MSLSALWHSSPEQLRGKQVKQIIAFAGGGKLGDGSVASREFREYLALVPSEVLASYADECLAEKKFSESGFALQDVVNQLGRRLGFEVEDGRYRGSVSSLGYDGLWKSPTGHHIVVEVKSSATFKIDLDNIAGFRRGLMREGRVVGENSSILIIVGSEDTRELEAQIRGSRHAWDIRLISVEGLKRLVHLKEDIDDPATVRKIGDILVPYEYTRVDRIIDIVFSTAEEVLQEEETEEGPPSEQVAPAVTDGRQPVRFNAALAERVGQHLGHPLVKRSRTLFSSPDQSVGLISVVSKEHSTPAGQYYWYGFHEYHRKTLEPYTSAYIAFGCGSPDRLLLIPREDLEQWLDGMNSTQKADDFYRHVQIFREGERLVMHRRKGEARIDVTRYLLK
jgi:hypothetical protein